MLGSSEKMVKRLRITLTQQAATGPAWDSWTTPKNKFNLFSGIKIKGDHNL